jgi:hypothetical protein
VYKLVPNGTASQESVLYAFCAKRDCKDGNNPEGGVILDASGNLFGTTFLGGGNDIDQGGVGGGILYELVGGSEFTVLHRFCSRAGCADGEYPDAKPVKSGDSIYGVTAQGGAFGIGGTAFQLVP